MPFDFNRLGVALYQDHKFRLGDSRFFAGGKLAYLDTKSSFDLPIGDTTQLPLGSIKSRNVGIAAEVSFDGRDNTFTPN